MRASNRYQPSADPNRSPWELYRRVRFLPSPTSVYTHKRGDTTINQPFFPIGGGGKAATVTHFLWRNNVIVVRKFAVLRTSHVPLSALIDSRALRGNPPLFSSFFCFSFLSFSFSLSSFFGKPLIDRDWYRHWYRQSEKGLKDERKVGYMWLIWSVDTLVRSMKFFFFFFFFLIQRRRVYFYRILLLARDAFVANYFFVRNYR